MYFKDNLSNRRKQVHTVSNSYLPAFFETPYWNAGTNRSERYSTKRENDRLVLSAGQVALSVLLLTVLSSFCC